MIYNPQEIEPKWQNAWTSDKQTISDKPKAYVLEMFPYPSGRIHMGHLRNYSIGDAIARYKTAQGFDVLHPMGWDAFGLPAENAAIENKVNPADWTYQNIDTMRTELSKIGFSYDWSKELATCHPQYYKHEQAFFLKFLEQGLAYQKEATVNWDPVDNTVLANEQVIDGRGWRSGALVERRKLKQWFLKITDFAEDLLEGLNGLEGWPNAVKVMQEKWIGKSVGAHISFEVIGRDEKLDVFTTRPDTIFGAAFCGIAPGHPIAEELAAQNPELAAFIEECNQIANTEEAMEKAEKKGFDTGLRIKHPFTGAELPLYIANFILMEYGTGAIFGCPAHDERDQAFAEKYGLPIVEVVGEDGVLKDSDFLNGLKVEEAKERAVAEFEKLDAGKKQITYRLRDWGVSRQRYWGCPIPIIYCDDCGSVPVPAADLPVELPRDVEFDSPGNPLDRHPTWKNVDCPSCGRAATRETDTFDTFFESSWYFARFPSMGQDGENPLAGADEFLPVDNYIGGIEHAVLHLLYARFFTRALNKCGYIKATEPFKNLLTQGMVCHPTFKNAAGEWIYPEDADENSVKGASIKMSKSKKNVVDPSGILQKYGADTARLFMLSDSPPERDLEWSDEGVAGCFKFLTRVWNLAKQEMPEAADDKARKSIHGTIKAATDAFENSAFNVVVAQVRSLFNELSKNPSREGVDVLLKLLQPLCPHISAELLGELAEWPTYDESLLQADVVQVAVQVNGKKRAIVELPAGADEATAKEIALAHENVVGFVTGGIKKFIYVPNRIINIVA